MFAWGLLLGVLIGAIGVTIVTAIYVRRIHRLQQHSASVARLAELGTLTGGLAHEIKNPLSTIGLNAQLLAEGVEELPIPEADKGRLSRRIGALRREVERLRGILTDFLQFAGQLRLEPRPADLNQVVEELADFFLPQAQQQRAKVRLRRADQPLIAPVDPRLIKQAVLNLMLNALQAMPQGGDLILSASKDDGAALIDIIDTGKGIAPEAIDKIFQAYYTSKKGGTGLGLAMTQRIVKEHGGQLSVTSEMGKGSDFQLRLPLK